MIGNKKIIMCTGHSPDKPLVYVLRGKYGDLLIDTGSIHNTRQIDRWIRSNGFSIKWVFLTHGHFDHSWSARFLKEKYGAKIIMHECDREILGSKVIRPLTSTSEKGRNMAILGNKAMQVNTAPPCDVDIYLTDRDTDALHKLGFDEEVVMLHGHTLGSMGILQGRVLYAGDAISAKKGEYYTAFIGEDVKEIYRSELKIFGINPLIIAPGHGQLVVNERAFIG